MTWNTQQLLETSRKEKGKFTFTLGIGNPAEANSRYVNIDYIFLSSLLHNHPHPWSYCMTLHVSGQSNLITDWASIHQNWLLHYLILICGSSCWSFICQLISWNVRLTTHSTSLHSLGGQMARPPNVASQKPMRWLQAWKRWAWVHTETHLTTILGTIIGGKLPKWVFITGLFVWCEI